MSAVVTKPAVEGPAVATSRPADPGPTGRLAVLKNRALATLMFGHFSVDMYSGVIPVLYPLADRQVRAQPEHGWASFRSPTAARRR